MATLWRQTATLLVLMVMSCPSSKATSLQPLCGPHLADALFLVCGDRGFYFNTVRDDIPAQSETGNAASTGAENEGAALQGQMGGIAKRSIVERCCYRPCTILDLEDYCLERPRGHKPLGPSLIA